MLCCEIGVYLSLRFLLLDARRREAVERALERGEVFREVVRDRKGRRLRGPGERYSVAGYRRAIGRACVELGIGVWNPNQLRHTVGTEIRRRFGIEGAQVVLGHAELGVTQVYAERDRARAIAIQGEIG